MIYRFSLADPDAEKGVCANIVSFGRLDGHGSEVFCIEAPKLLSRVSLDCHTSTDHWGVLASNDEVGCACVSLCLCVCVCLSAPLPIPLSQATAAAAATHVQKRLDL